MRLVKRRVLWILHVGPCAEALYDFEAENDAELAFREGDKITLLSRVDDNWFEGKNRGKTGLFPVNYVRVIVDLPWRHLTGSISEAHYDSGFFLAFSLLYCTMSVCCRWKERWRCGETFTIDGVDFFLDQLPFLLSQCFDTAMELDLNLWPDLVRRSWTRLTRPGPEVLDPVDPTWSRGLWPGDPTQQFDRSICQELQTTCT